jgi:hypothetical protein
VVFTCGVSVLQGFRRSKAVLGGLQGVVNTQKWRSEKAGVGGSTPSLATIILRSSPETWVTDRT